MASQSTDTLPKDETLREATVEDYQAVLDLETGGYDGLDYLPATFRSLVEGQGVKGYVYLKQGKVVGFLSTKIVDGGQTVMTLAGRVHPDHRGHGLYGRFNRRVLKQFETSPSLRRNVCTVGTLNMEKRRQSLLSQFSVVMEKMITYMTVEVDQVRTELSKVPVHSMCPPQPLTYQQLHSMLSQPPSRLAHLFPQQRILVGWESLRVMSDNADVIGNNSKQRVFVAAGEELASIGKGNYLPVTLMSCGSHYPCQRGRMYDLDIFGSGSDADVRNHLVWHLRRLTEVGEEKSAIMRMYSESNLHHLVITLQTQFSIQHMVSPDVSSFVLEADFN
ncbi:histidine N-acetyltransferase-like [Babylonia areolata]|uniref:histidine N-acetyltransferase-like n=1 Tax=Babylonia areolata TaxID=304850 RepID=UPI003FD62B35